MSDHMQEAVNYIKHMQKRIQELKMRREMRSNFSGTKIASSNSNEKLVNQVVVNPGLDGVEILISSGCKSFGLGLGFSGVLQELQARGLNVVSCLSTKENDQRFLHKIHAEVKLLTIKMMNSIGFLVLFIYSSSDFFFCLIHIFAVD